MPFQRYRVVSPDGNTVAELIPEAGMLCSTLVDAGEQLLDGGKGLEAYAQTGATMGIPLLYPWANRLDGLQYAAAGASVQLPDDRSRVPQDPNGLPIHGLVPRMMRWEPEQRQGETSLTATLAWSSPQLLDLYPFAHETAITVVADNGALTFTTTVHAGGEAAVPVSFGYHPYLRLPGSGRASWQVQLPAMEHLALDQRMIPTGVREPMAAASRAFELADTELGRRVRRARAARAVCRLGRRPRDRPRVARGLPVRPDLRAPRTRLHLLRADDRAHQRAAQRRRAIGRATGRLQTEKVWSFADEFKLPRALVINKLDRERASFDRALASIQSVFGRTAVPIQLPWGAERDFKGVIDLVRMKAYSYTAGRRR